MLLCLESLHNATSTITPSSLYSFLLKPPQTRTSDHRTRCHVLVALADETQVEQETALGKTPLKGVKCGNNHTRIMFKMCSTVSCCFFLKKRAL
jgi:hypothetical protein